MLQQPATGPYLEPAESNAQPLTYFYILCNIINPSMPRSLKWFLPMRQLKILYAFLILPCMLNVLPISPSLSSNSNTVLHLMEQVVLPVLTSLIKPSFPWMSQIFLYSRSTIQYNSILLYSILFYCHPPTVHVPPIYAHSPVFLFKDNMFHSFSISSL